MPDNPKPYGPVRYGPKFGKERDRIEGQKRRDDKFIQAIIEEQAAKGKKISYEQGKRELASQQRLSQKEIMWQEHRTTLKEMHLTEAERREGPPHKRRIIKKMALPKEDQIEALQRQLKERDEMIEALKNTIREQNDQIRQIRKELTR